MGQINLGRVILGGIVAGIIIDIVEGIMNGWLLADQFTAAMTALGKTTFGTGEIVAFNIYGLIVGLVAVWIYAGFRPRFGAGPRTAVIAAVTTWVPAYLLANAIPVVLGILPLGLVAIVTIVGLVEVIVATWAGAALYQEA